MGKFYHPPSHHKIATEIFQKGNNLPNHFQWFKNVFFKGQLISKANCQAVNSSKKRPNEFVFTTM